MQSLLRERSFRALTISQFLGALNDNAFKQFVLLGAALGGFAAWDGGAWARDFGQAAGQAAFALPFIVFAPLAGLLADRVSKRSVIVVANVAEVAVMLLACAALALRSTGLLFTTVALMGTQSAFFGPSKYGAIPELVPASELARANGWIQTSTFVAILGGLVLGGLGADLWLSGAFEPGLAFVVVAVLGALASLSIRPLPAAAPEAAAGRWSPLRSLRAGWRTVRADRPLALAILCGGAFWMFGSALVLVVNAWGAEHALGGTDIAWHLGALAVGVATGSFVAGSASAGRIEIAFVPLGLFGMALSVAATALVAPATPAAWGALGAAGVSAGLYSVPMRALIQARAPRERRGSVLGLSECIDFVGIFAASGAFAVFELLAWSPEAMFLALAGMIGVLGLITLGSTSAECVRASVRWIVRRLVRLRVHGIGEVPREGGVLLVGNHVSYLDGFLVAASSPRPVRFLMHKDFFRWPLFGRFARAMGVLPVASGDASSTTADTLRRATEAAASGAVVCIFAEGAITRSGALLGFRRGLETIARRAGVPIVPVAIHGLTDRSFDLRRGRAALGAWRSDVRVRFGRALASDASAWDVRQAVACAVAEAAVEARDTGPSLAAGFVRSAKRHARRPAVADAEGAWSYRRLLVASLATARALDRVLPSEDRVGVCLPPSRGAALLSVATALSGRSAVLLNYLLATPDLERALERTGARTLVTSRRFVERLGRAAPCPPGGRVLYLEDLDVGRADRAVAWATSRLPSALLARVVERRARSTSELCVLFSSGSTAEPKGVRLSHGNVAANVDAFRRMTDAGPADRVLGVLPLFHAFGLTGTLWMPLLAGASVHYHPNPLDARALARLARAWEPTLLLGAPSFFAAWLRRFEPADVARVRLAIVGAERLDPRLAEAWQERFPFPLYEGYGCTELAPAVTFSLPDFDSPASHQVGSRPGSVGRALPGVALRVVDTETGAVLPPDHEGLVCVRSPGCMLGYLGRDDLTSQALRDGWYVTGDVGRLDREGFLTLTDRLARFSKVGGEMVSHARLEEELRAAFARAFPERPVPDLAVTSIADERRAERLCVVYALDDAPDDDDTRDAPPVDAWWAELAAAELPSLFLPRPADFVAVRELPRLASGKLDLRGLRAAAGMTSAA